MSRVGLSTKRVFRAGFLNFTRNKTVSMSSLSILTVTLLIIGIFFFFRGIFAYSLNQIKSKVDIKIYFKLDATDAQVNNIFAKIKDLPEVDSVALTSKEQALIDFQVTHANDPVTLEALKEVGDNPFGNMLTVVARDTNSYESISNTLDLNSGFLGEDASSIDKINYFELKSSIDRLNNIVNWINLAGFWITMLFVVISLLITFNTIRLSIFIYKEEISVMKLVGASNMYIRGPFLVEAGIHAVLSTVLSMLLFLPITYWVTDKTKSFFNGLDLFQYYLDNFFALFSLLLLISFVLTFLSSILAIRKYLKI